MTKRTALAAILVALAACRANTVEAPQRRDATTDSGPTDSSSEPSTASASEPRTIVVERAIGTARAEGTAIVRNGAETHERLAGARAWAALGRAKEAEGVFEDAVAAARSGLDELGPDYATLGVIDDTDLKRRAGEAQYSRGRIDDAAYVLLRVLETRIRLYVSRYADVVVK
jgi:hypothetical protein